MRKAQASDPQSFEDGDRFAQLLGGREAQMSSPQDRVDRLPGKLGLDVVDGVDQAGMAAAKNQG